MIWRLLTTIAFVASSTLSGLCSMPMANAMADEPMQDMGSMAHDDCDNCPHEEHQSEKKMPCDSGHCLSAHKSETSVSSGVNAEMRIPAMLNTLPISISEPIFDLLSWLSIKEGPPLETGIRTIVLRQ